MRVPSLALLSGLRIQRCSELWGRSQVRFRSGIAVLWRRPAATAPIGPLAWEPPYAVGSAPKRQPPPKKIAECQRSKQDSQDTVTIAIKYLPVCHKTCPSRGGGLWPLSLDVPYLTRCSKVRDHEGHFDCKHSLNSGCWAPAYCVPQLSSDKLFKGSS